MISIRLYIPLGSISCPFVIVSSFSYFYHLNKYIEAKELMTNSGNLDLTVMKWDAFCAIQCTQFIAPFDYRGMSSACKDCTRGTSQLINSSLAAFHGATVLCGVQAERSWNLKAAGRLVPLELPLCVQAQCWQLFPGLLFLGGCVTLLLSYDRSKQPWLQGLPGRNGLPQVNL